MFTKAWQSQIEELPEGMSEIEGRRRVGKLVAISPLIASATLNEFCKTSSVPTDESDTLDVISISEGKIGNGYSVSKQGTNNLDLGSIVGAGYNTSRAGIWEMSGNNFVNKVGSVKDGVGSFNHNGTSKYAVVVIPSNLDGLMDDMDAEVNKIIYLEKRDHTVGYENDEGATEPAGGKEAWANKIDEINNTMVIPNFGRFGSLSGFPNGTDFTVGFGTANYNGGLKVRVASKISTPGGQSDKMDEETVEQLTDSNNIGGNTTGTIRNYGIQPIMAISYLIGDYRL